jgi:hypothetical protein
MRWVPERRFAVSILSNGYHLFEGTADCALNAYLAPGPGPSEPPCPRQPERWAGWVGRYAGQDYVGQDWSAEVRLDDSGQLEAAFTVPGGARPAAPLVQSCNDARSNGPSSFGFDYDGNGSRDLVASFIADPVEPGVVWLRHRQLVLRREAPEAIATATTTATATPTATVAAPTATPTAPGRAYLPWARR